MVARVASRVSCAMHDRKVDAGKDHQRSVSSIFTSALANIAKSIIFLIRHQKSCRFALNLIRLDRSDLYS
jgi:hypothetical protein